MLFFTKHIILVLLSVITLFSGSGVSTIKMVCLCSGDTSFSFTNDDSCEETIINTDETILDHKCCEVDVLNLKLDKTTCDNKKIDFTNAFTLVFSVSQLLFNFNLNFFTAVIPNYSTSLPPPKEALFLLIKSIRI